MKKIKTAAEVCRGLKSIFSRRGIPEKVQSDNGRPFDWQMSRSPIVLQMSEDLKKVIVVQGDLNPTDKLKELSIP